MLVIAREGIAKHPTGSTVGLGRRMEKRDGGRPPSALQHRDDRRWRDHDASARRPSHRIGVSSRCPAPQLVTAHEPWRAVPDDEHAVRELVEDTLVMALGSGVVEPLCVQPRVDGSGGWTVRPASRPQPDEAAVVLATALGTWPMPGGQRRRIVQEEQLRVPPRLHQRAPAVLEVKSARDPRRARMGAANPAFGVVQASPVAKHQPARRISDDPDERRDAILTRHDREDDADGRASVTATFRPLPGEGTPSHC
jgi:hypothetical protein